MITGDVIQVITSNITVYATVDIDIWIIQKDRREWLDLSSLAINCPLGNTANTQWLELENT